MKKAYLNPEISIEDLGPMATYCLNTSGSDADSSKPVLSKDRFSNFADELFLDEEEEE